MQISSVSGNTYKRTFLDIESDNSVATVYNALSTYTTNKKVATVGSSRYTRLDSSMPAVAFVNFNTSAGGLFLTNITPPKYIKSFECERVCNSVGKFTLNLQCPIDTFEAGSDDLNIKLINLFGHIDSGNMNDTDGYQCDISYGWRNSSSKSIIKYENALITGMTLNYKGNYYEYTITGLVNQLSNESFETGVKILSTEKLASIDSSKLSDSALGTYETYSGTDVSTLLDTTGATATQYKIIIPKGTKIYEIDSNKTVTATARTTETDATLMYSNRQSNNTTWTDDYLYCYNSPRGSFDKLNCYSVSDIKLYKFIGGNITDTSSSGDEVDVAVGLDLTSVKAGERISNKVEILAQYLYGDLYDIVVAHTDKQYDEDSTIATILSSLDNEDAAENDKSSDTTNETSTSLHTWLKQMVKACRDCTESDLYDTYKQYDTNNDGILSKADIEEIQKTDKTAIADKWKKHGINTYTYESKNSRGNINTRETTAFSRKMTEAEFNKYYKDYTYLNGPYSNEYLQNPLEFIGPIQFNVKPDFVGPIQSLYSTMSRTYADYEADYNAYQLTQSITADSAELNELLDSYGGTLQGGPSAVQYHLYFIDPAAGQSKGTIYIGPAKDDTYKHQYIVGNKLKDSVVLDFSTTEDLIYLISLVKSYVSASNSGLYQIDVDTGGIIKGSVDTSSQRIDSKEEYATRVASKILSDIAIGKLKANLTVLSDATSRTIQTTDNISILCQNNGGKTMFSGSYMVSSVKDTISESGKLTTTMELQFTQSSAFKTVRDIIISHLNKALNTSGTSSNS